MKCASPCQMWWVDLPSIVGGAGVDAPGPTDRPRESLMTIARYASNESDARPNNGQRSFADSTSKLRACLRRLRLDHYHRSVLLHLLCLTPPTEGFHWDKLRKL